MNQSHCPHLASDYVLDLLPQAQRAQLEEHARQCPPCRDAILAERQLVAVVRRTLLTAGRPQAGQLERLQPAIPRHTAGTILFGRRMPGWSQAAMAACFLVIILGFGSLLMNSNLTTTPEVVATGPSGTAMAATATAVPTSLAPHDVELSVQEQEPPPMTSLRWPSPDAVRLDGTPVAALALEQSWQSSP